MTLASEARRPGITKLYQRVVREHPNWSMEQCQTHAKALYTNRFIAQEVNGEMREVHNPDYMAARDR